MVSIWLFLKRMSIWSTIVSLLEIVRPQTELPCESGEKIVFQKYLRTHRHLSFSIQNIINNIRLSSFVFNITILGWDLHSKTTSTKTNRDFLFDHFLIGHLKSDSEYICGSRDFRPTKITNYLEIKWIVREMLWARNIEILLYIRRREQSRVYAFKSMCVSVFVK